MNAALMQTPQTGTEALTGHSSIGPGTVIVGHAKHGEWPAKLSQLAGAAALAGFAAIAEVAGVAEVAGSAVAEEALESGTPEASHFQLFNDESRAIHCWQFCKLSAGLLALSLQRRLETKRLSDTQHHFVLTARSACSAVSLGPGSSEL